MNLPTGTVDSAPPYLRPRPRVRRHRPHDSLRATVPSKQFGSLTPGIKPPGRIPTTAPAWWPQLRRGGGYNVITWDPRGEFASGGQLQIDNPFYEGRDVSEIISWLTGSTNPAQDQVLTDPTGDPLVGMTGGSYGGGIQLTTVDPRIDAIIPRSAGIR